MKKFFLLAVSLLLLSCSSIRMKYESDILVEGQKTQHFVYENSYPVGGAHAPLCGITAIFLGGSCWYYLVMPTVQQKQIIAEDADDFLKKKMGPAKFEEEKIKVSKVSYQEGSEQTEFFEKERPNSTP